MQIKTPYYLIDESKLQKNLEIISKIKEVSGAKVLLALKCFSSYQVFPLLKKYLDGTTSSSLYETKLGYEEFGKETQAYCVGYADSEIDEISNLSDKIIFNSIDQLKRYYPRVVYKNIGLRVNPERSYSQYDLANPSRKFSKLGVHKHEIKEALPFIKGLMFHFNCDNTDFENFENNLEAIGTEYLDIFRKLEWVSLGGGVLFTKKGYPYRKFAKTLKNFSEKHRVQIYLEPGEAIIHDAGELVTSVVDFSYNGEHIAVVDASTEPHMLDLVIYRLSPELCYSVRGKYCYHVVGRSCLAGDVFGVYYFNKPLKIGDLIHFKNGIGYSIVKKNWFNGLQIPTTVVKRLDGSIAEGKNFSYKDYKSSLS